MNRFERREIWNGGETRFNIWDSSPEQAALITPDTKQLSKTG